MIEHDHLDRLLTDVLLEDAPREAPDRLVPETMRALRDVRRRPRWLAYLKEPPMRISSQLAVGSPTARLATILAATLLLLVLATGAVLAGATLLAGPVAAVPSELQHDWIRAERPGSNLGYSAISIGERDLTVTAGEAAILRSNASLAVQGILALEADSPGVGCEASDAGTYDYQASPDGLRLTLAVLEDTCEPRAAAVAGDWFLTECEPRDTLCLGDLAPGTYQTAEFDPRYPSDTYGAVTYTVPEGWANTADLIGIYSLAPATEYATYGSGFDGGPWPDSITLWANPAAASQDCTKVQDDGIGTSPDNLVDWLRQLPGIVTSEPVTVTIDHHPGWQLDVDIDPETPGPCFGSSYRPLFKEDNTDEFGYYWGLEQGIGGANESARLILLDLGSSQEVLISIFTRDGTRRATHIEEAMPIVNSMVFAD